MHALVLTVLALAGGNGTAYSVSDQGVRELPQTVVVQYVDDGGVDYSLASHHGGLSNRKAAAIAKPPHGGCLGMMPQTCYSPKFGCYDAERHNNRYPAFHGTYYRRPYAYRNVFDYPWHAELHEPVSHFAFHTDLGPAGAAPAPVVAPAIAPVVNAAPQMQRTAQAYPAPPQQRALAAPQGLRTLRR